MDLLDKLLNNNKIFENIVINYLAPQGLSKGIPAAALIADQSNFDLAFRKASELNNSSGKKKANAYVVTNSASLKDQGEELNLHTLPIKLPVNVYTGKTDYLDVYASVKNNTLIFYVNNEILGSGQQDLNQWLCMAFSGLINDLRGRKNLSGNKKILELLKDICPSFFKESKSDSINTQIVIDYNNLFKGENEKSAYELLFPDLVVLSSSEIDSLSPEKTQKMLTSAWQENIIVNESNKYLNKMIELDSTTKEDFKEDIDNYASVEGGSIVINWEFISRFKLSIQQELIACAHSINDGGLSVSVNYNTDEIVPNPVFLKFINESGVDRILIDAKTPGNEVKESFINDLSLRLENNSIRQDVIIASPNTYGKDNIKLIKKLSLGSQLNEELKGDEIVRVKISGKDFTMNNINKLKEELPANCDTVWKIREIMSSIKENKDSTEMPELKALLKEFNILPKSEQDKAISEQRIAEKIDCESMPLKSRDKIISFLKGESDIKDVIDDISLYDYTPVLWHLKRISNDNASLYAFLEKIAKRTLLLERIGFNVEFSNPEHANNYEEALLKYELMDKSKFEAASIESEKAVTEFFRLRAGGTTSDMPLFKNTFNNKVKALKAMGDD